MYCTCSVVCEVFCVEEYAVKGNGGGEVGGVKAGGDDDYEERRGGRGEGGRVYCAVHVRASSIKSVTRTLSPADQHSLRG